VTDVAVTDVAVTDVAAGRATRAGQNDPSLNDMNTNEPHSGEPHSGEPHSDDADTRGVAPGARGAAGVDVRTRDRVARLLLEAGPSTAGSLSERLGLSPAAIRRHLDAMLAAGTIKNGSARGHPRRGRGRPARLYELTDAGHAAGPTAYEDLAASALGFLADVAGPAMIAEFAASRASDLERRVRASVAGGDSARRPDAVAAAMSAAGYTASVSELPTGTQICQHHCPVQHVAERFPELCDAETAAIARLLGTHVQRLATIAHGDGVCTTHIPSGHWPESDSTNPTASNPTASEGFST
jgi:predicted ArsR family transcriptional regulator